MADAVIDLALDAPKVDARLVAETLGYARRALSEIERAMTGENPVATWAWESGPVSLRAQANGVPEGGLQDIKRAFHEGVRAAAQGRPDLWPDQVPNAARDAILLLITAARQLERLVISSNGETPIIVNPDVKLLAAASREPTKRWTMEYSIVDGTLDLISVRHAFRFSIDDYNTGAKVVCNPAPDRIEEVKAALGKRVVAEGDVQFDTKGRPRNISNIKSFWVRSEPIPISEYTGRISDLIGREEPADHVRKLRHGLERT